MLFVREFRYTALADSGGRSAELLYEGLDRRVVLPKVVCNSARALSGVSKQDAEERLPRDCWDKCRLEVHVLLGLLTDKDIQTSWCEAGAMEHCLVS